MKFTHQILEPTTGIEPVTSSLPRMRSNQLSYAGGHGGEGRIRTFEGVQPTDLQSAPFNHFGTSPVKSPSTGADDPIRTDDLLITNQLLYQLSYTGNI